VADRVKIGLANARAKGKLIGRKKMRDSDLIRKLLKAGMTYRNISIVAKYPLRLILLKKSSALIISYQLEPREVPNENERQGRQGECGTRAGAQRI
jgi:DNA invertase Pin-like site-specific DNA recombinase